MDKIKSSPKPFNSESMYYSSDFLLDPMLFAGEQPISPWLVPMVDPDLYSMGYLAIGMTICDNSEVKILPLFRNSALRTFCLKEKKNDLQERSELKASSKCAHSCLCILTSFLYHGISISLEIRKHTRKEGVKIGNKRLPCITHLLYNPLSV